MSSHGSSGLAASGGIGLNLSESLSLLRAIKEFTAGRRENIRVPINGLICGVKNNVYVL